MKPATDAELQAFYGAELSATAMLIAQERVCSNCDEFADFLGGSTDEREPCLYFGNIGTQSLVSQILLNANATDSQIAAAARELRARFLADRSELVERIAVEVSQ